MNKSEQFLDFFNKAYNDPNKHSNYSTNSELRFDSRSDALTVKHLLEDQSPYAKYYHLSAEYINPNQSMQVGWYLTVRKVANLPKEGPASSNTKPQTHQNDPKDTHQND
ncbi:hypothetical protein ACFQ22_06800 [Lentilactobacillus raoultii]|uniref:Uncharacterized protein n=1 Tax=Lentilactobacillus raoultii TaxID=1987503 RepID=A0ABW3PDV8_9LACO|nr:hypothetical protein [Lentilactobacillus raoultii]